MARILITSGPTRQYLDPVRYLTNASSGRMGGALALAALTLGHDVVVVSGPVQINYPDGATVLDVVSTEEMLDVCRKEFSHCDGVIGAAAPCDYRPIQVHPKKIHKTGEPLLLHLIETDDVIATLGTEKSHQWLVGFALETQDHRLRALAKLEEKSCDLIILNRVEAMNSPENQVVVINGAGEVTDHFSGDKDSVAHDLLGVIQRQLVQGAGRA